MYPCGYFVMRELHTMSQYPAASRCSISLAFSTAASENFPDLGGPIQTQREPAFFSASIIERMCGTTRSSNLMKLISSKITVVPGRCFSSNVVKRGVRTSPGWKYGASPGK